MSAEHDLSAGGMDRYTAPGLQVTTIPKRAHREVFITAVPTAGESVEALFGRIAAALHDRGARAVSLEVHGLSNHGPDDAQALSAAFGGLACPVACIGQSRGPAGGLGGVQVWAVAGVPVQPVKLDDRLVGSVFEDDDALYVRLASLLPPDRTQPRTAQARAVLEQMEMALHAVDMEFSNVVRTWFFNDDILSWYADFNRARDTFFRQRRVPDGLLPASTGVGVHHIGAPAPALMGGLLAVRPNNEAVHAVAVPSPLQRPAREYGSSFSRAVELVAPDQRSLLISGTASIAPEGHTLHIGDVQAQVAHTLDVVHAILESRGMEWTDVLEAVGYFKHAADASAFRRCCAGSPAASMPVVLTHSVICRPDLLFELEAHAARATQGVSPSDVAAAPRVGRRPQ